MKSFKHYVELVLESTSQERLDRYKESIKKEKQREIERIERIKQRKKQLKEHKEKFGYLNIFGKFDENLAFRTLTDWQLFRNVGEDKTIVKYLINLAFFSSRNLGIDEVIDRYKNKTLGNFENLRKNLKPILKDEKLIKKVIEKLYDKILEKEPDAIDYAKKKFTVEKFKKLIKPLKDAL